MFPTTRQSPDMNVHNLKPSSMYFTFFFDVLLTVLHLSIFISVFNQLDAQNFCFTISFISCLYMFRAHVLIIRSSKLHYTASGILTPIGVMHKICFIISFISCLYMFRAHVLETCRDTK